MKAEFNKYLKSLSREELEKELQKIYGKFKDVKEYYTLELSGDSSKILDEYKKKIRNEYFPTRGHGKGRSSVSKKAITDFKKISVFPEDMIDLLLYRTENMLEFTLDYGDIGEQFAVSIESSFHDACKLIQKEGLAGVYLARCKELLAQAQDAGWGIDDNFGIYIDEYLS